VPDWLTKSFAEPPAASWQVLLPRLVAALALGAVVAGVFRATRRGSDSAASFPATLVLLTILIALVTQVIGDNVARAFSLVGTLSIVRFRTVVRDTKDTAFVIFAVVIGMAVGAGQITGAICGIAVTSAAAVLFRDRPAGPAALAGEVLVKLRLAWSDDAEAAAAEAISRYASQVTIASAGTARQGMLLELAFRAVLRPDVRPSQLIAALNRLEGVQGVELAAVGDGA
jgi:hypothetical protein